MRIALILMVFLLLAALGLALAIRLAPMEAARWHVLPAEATPPDTPNFVLLRGAEAPVLDAPPATVAARLAAVAEAEGATRLAGDLAAGFATYVQRSRLMGYPDAVSLALVAEGTGTRIEVFSRSRFGYSDLGVNAARVARWLAAAAAP